MSRNKKVKVMTSIPIAKETRTLLAEFCGKMYKMDCGTMTYDEGIRKLLKFWRDVHGQERDI